MKDNDLRILAAKHGLQIQGELTFNEIGLDFRIVFAETLDGRHWVLRIPRRPDIFLQIEHEARILNLVKRRLRISVPDWKVVSPELIAYPLLTDKPAISSDPVTHEMTWNIESESKEFIVSLAQTLADLHATPISEAEKFGLKVLTPLEARKEISEEIDLIKSNLGMNANHERQLRDWVSNDSLWPEFSVLAHGDLYAGHILTERSGRITGIIDWSEAEVTDPSLDFAGHLAVFGEESLKALINEYDKAGGRTWSTMLDQIKERHSASFLKFAVFALNSGNDEYIAAAKTALQGP